MVTPMVTGPGRELLPGLDRAAFGAALACRLRRSGMAVGLTEAGSFTAGLEVCPPTTRTALYWLARVALVRQPSDLECFDDVFDALFAGAGAGLDPHARRRGQAQDDEAANRRASSGASSGDETPGGLPWATRAAVGVTHDDDDDDDDDDDSPRSIPDVRPSALDRLSEDPFPELDLSQLAALDGLLLEAMTAWPTRRSRHLRPHARGSAVAIRPTLARARRNGFEPLRLVTTRPAPRRRRVVMLCDVSQSMQPFAAAYLHLLRAAAVAASAEVFVFATTLTRLTPILARAAAEDAVARASDAVADRFGGTRIASNIAALLRSRHGDAVRGAIVVVASDGWDSDPPDALRRQMARLGRRAYRVIWLNPRMAAPGYSPQAGGMAAALPYCDHVLPADTMKAMADVVRAITRP